MTNATLPASMGAEYLRLLDAKDETGIFNLLADDAQIVDELTRRWVRGRHEIGAALRQLFTRVTDLQSIAEDVHAAGGELTRLLIRRIAGEPAEALQTLAEPTAHWKR